MSEAKNKRRRVRAGTNLAASSALLSAVLLAGCGSVGDAVNPVHWYNGVSDWVSGTPAKSTGDFPKVGDDKRPETPSTKERTDLAKGLAADLANAKHTEESLHREGNPTRPLSAEAAKPATSVVKLQPAAAPGATPVSPPSLLKPTPADAPVETKPAAAAPPAPAESNAAPDAPPAPPPAPAESKAAPVAPSAKTAVTPPPVARAAVPPRVAQAELPPPVAQAAVPPPVPVSAAPPPPPSVDQVYRHRLAESTPAITASTDAPNLVAGTAPGLPQQSVVLTRPVQLAKAPHAASGVQALDAYKAAKNVSSFQVGTIGFGEGTAELVPGEDQHLKDVAQLVRQKGGTVRILGRSASPRLDVDPTANREANRQLADRRAEVVAQQLVRLGVPGHKLYAGAALDLGTQQPAGAVSAGDATEIYIDY